MIIFQVHWQKQQLGEGYRGVGQSPLEVSDAPRLA